MLTRAIPSIACVALLMFVAFPAEAFADNRAQTGGGSGTGSFAPTPSAENALSQLEGLTQSSIENATSDPDNPYTPFPVSQAFGDGSAEGETALTNGRLVSTVFLNGQGTRTVAKVDAQVCPNDRGVVSAKITVNIGAASPTDDDRVIEALATGKVNDNAELTSPSVHVVTGKGKDAALLQKFGLAVLHQAEAAFQNGLCVKVDVSEGQSRAVAPQAKVPISATATQRFDGTTIKGRMDSKKTAGQKKVEPATVSGSPAKFTYTAPDKRPETGAVTLKSVSRRGIGTAVLAYTTEGDLKVDYLGVTATKCGGPEGDWTLLFEARLGGVAVVGSATATFTLPEGSLQGPYSFAGSAETGFGTGSFGETGIASYRASSDGTSGTLSLSQRGEYPVTIGTFCVNGKPPGG